MTGYTEMGHRYYLNNKQVVNYPNFPPFEGLFLIVSYKKLCNILIRFKKKSGRYRVASVEATDTNIEGSNYLFAQKSFFLKPLSYLYLYALSRSFIINGYGKLIIKEGMRGGTLCPRSTYLFYVVTYYNIK